VGSEVIDLRGLELIEQWIASLGTASTPRAPADASTTSTEGALALVRAIDRGELGGAARQEAIARGVEHPNDAIRGLFVRFAPPEPRDDVLGDSLDSKKLLSMAGDAQRGRGVFFESPAAATCRTCHGPQARGTTLGPDLSHIGIKYSRAELLEQILEPSRRVDEPFVLHIIEMDDGGYRNGFVAHRDEREIVLRDLSGQEMRLKRDRIRKLEAQHVSTMPPLLLRSFTAQEAADLLSFLESLRSR
jgi:putative heme-binding domain-containing protein